MRRSRGQACRVPARGIVRMTRTRELGSASLAEPSVVGAQAPRRCALLGRGIPPNGTGWQRMFFMLKTHPLSMAGCARLSHGSRYSPGDPTLTIATDGIPGALLDTGCDGMSLPIGLSLPGTTGTASKPRTLSDLCSLIRRMHRLSCWQPAERFRCCFRPTQRWCRAQRESPLRQAALVWHGLAPANISRACSGGPDTCTVSC